MATKKVFLNLQPGQYMTWLISSQAGYKTRTVLKDDSITYCDFKNSTSAFESTTGHKKIEGNNLRLEIEIAQATTILMAESTGELVTSPDGEVVGYTRAYAFEDATDKDFNDVMVSIITHKIN